MHRNGRRKKQDNNRRRRKRKRTLEARESAPTLRELDREIKLMQRIQSREGLKDIKW